MWSQEKGWEPWRVFLQKVAPAEVCTWDAADMREDADPVLGSKGVIRTVGGL